MQPQNGSDEFHHCPACGRRTRHRVSRDRKLAPVLWCQTCFHVHVEAPHAPKGKPMQNRQDQAA